MKRITKSILSLCLAAVLSLTLLPAGARAVGEQDAPFMITGYRTDRSYIEPGDSVDVTVYLRRRDGAQGTISIIRNIDSFQGDSTVYAEGSEGSDGVTYSFTLRNLLYTGSGRELKFTIYYENETVSGYQDGNSIEVRECITASELEKNEDTEEPVEVIPEPRALFSSDGTVSAMSAGETRLVTISVENVGRTTMRDPILTVKSSGDLLLLDGQSDYILEDIRPNRSGSITVTVKAPDKIDSQLQELALSLSFYYDNGENLVSGGTSGSVSVLTEPSSGTQSSDVASPTPIVILTKYSYGGSSIAAGASANLSFTFTNTSKTLPIENVMVTVTGGNDLMLNGSTNTFYFDSVAAGGGKSVTVPLKAAQLVSSSAQEVTINVSYEYVDQGSRQSNDARLTLSVPLYQPDRFELGEPKVGYTGYVGEETSLTIDYVNKGKSAITNVEAYISGDVSTYSSYQRVGTIDGGKNGTIAFAVTPFNEGENAVTIQILYEDSNGNSKERIFETTVEAMAYPTYDPDLDDSGMIEEPVEESADIPWRYIIAAAAVVLVIVFVVLRRRKKKAKMLAEQALWDKWDEEELAREAAAAPVTERTEKEETVGAGAEEQKK